MHPLKMPVLAKVLRALGQASLAVLVAGCALLSACNQWQEDVQQEDIQQKLVGSWLREYEQEGARVRRLLVLGSDGQFTESARVVVVMR